MQFNKQAFQIVAWVLYARQPSGLRKIYYFYALIIFFVMALTGFSDTSFANPVVAISSDIIIHNENTIEVPIIISNVSEYGIEGYILRIDYSDQLSNPVLITNETLSQGKIIKSGPPSDGLGGKLAIGLMSGFNPEVDGIMLIIRLDVSENFENSDIRFVLIKSKLHTNLFKEIETSFINGHISRQKNFLDINNDLKINLVDVMMLLKYLSNL